MNYSVRYPEAWTAHPATELWLPGSRNLWDDPVGDRLEGRAIGFRGTSQALAKGQAADAWLKDYFGSGPSCGDPEQVHVGDHMGTVGLNGCAGRGRLGGRVYDVALVVDELGAAEPHRQLGGRGLRAVRRVNQVLCGLQREVSADGPRLGLTGFCKLPSYDGFLK